MNTTIGVLAAIGALCVLRWVLRLYRDIRASYKYAVKDKTTHEDSLFIGPDV